MKAKLKSVLSKVNKSRVFFLLAPLLSLATVEALAGNLFSFPFKYPLAFLFNVIWYFLIYFFLLGVCGSVKWSVLIGATFFYIFGMVNHFVIMFRGTPFLPWDFFSIKTAANVAGGYQFDFKVNLVLGTALFLLTIFLAWQTTMKMPAGKKGVVFRLSGVLLFVVYAVTFFTTNFYFSTGIYENLWEQDKNYKENGSLMAFLMNARYLSVSAPDDYNINTVENLMYPYIYGTDDIGKNEKTPNIIVIMNESFADLSVVGELKTNEDYMPFIRGLTENTIKGNALSSVFGGNTCNSEFEFLTGNSMAFLPSGSIAYQQYLHSDTFSLCYALKAKGYSTVAVHPYLADGWNRPQVYPRLGFDSFYSDEDFNDPEIIRKYISDRSSYEKVIELYKNKKKGEPLFVFNVTMQNHGGYDTPYDNFEETISFEGDELYPKAKQYLSLLKESDKAIEELINYFKDQEEPTIIVFFGDHQPKLEDEFYEMLYGKSTDELKLSELQKKYTVPFFIWANYDIPEQTVELTSLNYLSTLLLETADLSKPAYNKYLDELSEDIPAINSLGYVDSFGRHHSFGETTDLSERINEYNMLVYNNLFDKNNTLEQVFGTADSKGADKAA